MVVLIGLNKGYDYGNDYTMFIYGIKINVINFYLVALA